MSTLWLAAHLARAGGRLRTVSVVSCAALVTALALVMSVLTALWLGTGASAQLLSDNDRRLPLAVLAALGLPVVALLATTTRLSASVRDRRLAALRVLGVGTGHTRAVAAVEAALLSAVGVALGLVAVAAAAAAGAGQLLAVLPGVGEGVSLAQVPAAGWWAATAGVVGTSALVALAPTGTAVASSVSTTRQGLGAPPSWWRLTPLLAGAVLLALDPGAEALREHTAVTYRLPPTASLVAFVGGAVLAGLGIPLAVPVVVRRLAGALARTALPSTALLAARRLQLEPASSTRTVAALLVGVFIVTGAAGVLRASESTPQGLRTDRAATTGPQSISVYPATSTTTAADDVAVGLAALRRMPGVHAVAPSRPVPVACPDGAQAPDTLGCGEALVASCDQLPALAIDVTGCTTGTPTWVVPDRAFGDYSIGVPDAALQAPPVLVTLGDDAEAVTARLPLDEPAGRLALRKDPTDPFWGPLDPVLVVPPSTPGIDDFLGSAESYRVVADGGLDTIREVQATAAAHGLDALSTVPTEYARMQLYRALFLTLACVVLGIGLIALLATGIDHAVTRRRHLATLTTVGVPSAVVRGSQFLQAVAPLVIGLPVAGALGQLATTGFLADSGFSLPPAITTATTVVLLTLAAAVLAAAITITGLGRTPTPTDLRRE